MNGSLTRILHRASACAVIALAACSDRGQQAKVDSDLARDIALASRTTSEPQFEDTVVSPTPVKASPRASTEKRQTPIKTAARPEKRVEAPQPKPVPAAAVAEAPAPAARPAIVAQLGSGTQLELSSSERICTATNRPGDKFIATVTTSATGTNGAEIPAGARVVLEVARVGSGDSPETTQMGFRVRSIVLADADYKAAGDAVPTVPLERAKVANSDPNADKKKVIGGAIAGALLGQILGKSTKSTVIGAAAGAATGAAVAHAGQKYEACLPEGAPLRLTLSEPIVLATRD
jgi:hypothetical protein